MAYVQYNKYSFREPNIISRETYSSLREGLLSNPNTVIEPYSESYNEKFKGYLKIKKYCAIALLLSLVIAIPIMTIDGLKEWAENGFGHFLSTVAAVLFCLGFFVAFWVIFYLKKEGGSYSDFEKTKKAYYNRMKTCILKSSGYDDFLLLFKS